MDTHGPDGPSPTGPVRRFSPFAQARQQFAQRGLRGSNQTKRTKLRYDDRREDEYEAAHDAALRMRKAWIASDVGH